MNVKYYIYISIFIIWTALAVFTGWHLKPDGKYIPVDTTVTHIAIKAKPDSITTPKEKIKVKADTTKEENYYYASKDTVIGRDTVHIGYKSVEPIPMGEFDANIPVIVKTVIQDIQKPFYQTFTFGYIVGTAVTIVLVYLVSIIK